MSSLTNINVLKILSNINEMSQCTIIKNESLPRNINAKVKYHLSVVTQSDLKF